MEKHHEVFFTNKYVKKFENSQCSYRLMLLFLCSVALVDHVCFEMQLYLC